MSAEMRQEKARKLQSEAINNYMKLKENELEVHISDADKYKNICVGLTLALVLMVLGAAYVVYKHEQTPSCTKQEYVKPNPNDKYILERLR